MQLRATHAIQINATIKLTINLRLLENLTIYTWWGRHLLRLLCNNYTATIELHCNNCKVTVALQLLHLINFTGIIAHQQLHSNNDIVTIALLGLSLGWSLSWVLTPHWLKEKWAGFKCWLLIGWEKRAGLKYWLVIGCSKAGWLAGLQRMVDD